jgi:uncharacterized protein YlxP (DUF503 family)
MSSVAGATLRLGPVGPSPLIEAWVVMRVGVSRLVLQIPGARTLKDRRQVVRSFKDRARARFPVSIAEIGDANRLQLASFGVAVVSNDTAVCHDVLNAVTAMATALSEAVLVDVRVEVLPFGDDGDGINGGHPRYERGTAPLLEVEPVRRPVRRATTKPRSRSKENR